MNDPDKAKKDPAAADDGIDWANVAREAQTMVDLNRVATEAWQGSRKAEDNDSSTVER